MKKMLIVLAVLSTTACGEMNPVSPTSASQTIVSAAPAVVEPSTVQPAAPTYPCSEREAQVQAYISANGNFDTAFLTIVPFNEVVYISWQYDRAVPREVFHVSGPECGK